MPNKHAQITVEDFKAPPGQFRLILEDMNDGELFIVADFRRRHTALDVADWLETNSSAPVCTVWDEQGNVQQHTVLTL